MAVLVLLACSQPTLEERLKAQMIPSPGTQAEIDQNKILQYAIDHQLEVRSTSSGVYYLIEDPGEGAVNHSESSVATIHYRCSRLGRRLCDDVYLR